MWPEGFTCNMCGKMLSDLQKLDKSQGEISLAVGLREC
jgi:hypothetical protein